MNAPKNAEASNAVGQRPSDSRGEIRLVVRSEVNEIAPAIDHLMTRIRSVAQLQESQSDVEIALFEAVANAVVHGNREDPSKHVQIRCHCRRGRELSVVIKDEGEGFDPGAVPDPTSSANIEAEHGRGILMMKTFMDEVRFEKGGTEVHMLKKLHAPPGTFQKMRDRLHTMWRRVRKFSNRMRKD